MIGKSTESEVLDAARPDDETPAPMAPSQPPYPMHVPIISYLVPTSISPVALRKRWQKQMHSVQPRTLCVMIRLICKEKDAGSANCGDYSGIP